ncbi:MAG TPA: low temperature requirement protein A [Aeromicrobium sp.]|nr:low temperature requirement protein A [Aeromicrobium sp.]
MAKDPVPVASSREGDGVTTLELFFDLVYVFAFTQVTSLMAHGDAPRSLLQGFVILSLLWWSWCAFAWLANEARADAGVLQIAFVVVMAAMFLASVAIPEAFHDSHGGLPAPLLLAASYAVARLAHLGFYAIAARGKPELQRQLLVTLLVSVTPVIAILVAGALSDEHHRLWIWLAAVVYDFMAIWATSRRGGAWVVRSAAHFAERHGLIVILALGESVVAVGVGVADEPVTWRSAGGGLLALGVAVGLWFTYFDWLSEHLEERLAALDDRDRATLATHVFTYGHLPIVAGIILTALGAEQALGHLTDPHLGAVGGWALAGGIALVLTGTAAVAWRAGVGVLAVRLACGAALLASATVLSAAAPLLALAAVVAVLAVDAVVERRAGYAA